MYRHNKYKDERINAAVAELTEYTRQQAQIYRLQEKQAEYRERFSAIQAVAYDNIRVKGGASKDRLVEVAVKWAEMDVDINKKILAAENLLWKVKDKLERLPPLQAQILELYYIKTKSINKIAVMLSYSADGVIKAKAAGLKKYAEFPKCTP